MPGPITNRGKKWEYLNSIWLIWLAAPFNLAGFISFLYIGAKVDRFQWKLAGVAYFSITIASFYLVGSNETDEFLFDVGFFGMVGNWMFAIVHGFLARRLYLILLSGRSDDGTIEKRKNVGQKNRVSVAKGSDATIINSDAPFEGVLNINKASAEEVAKLPSIGNIVANQIIAVRNERGPFHSFPDFVEAVNMKPHILAKVKPHICFTDNDKNKKRTNRANGGKRHQKGRVVDF